MSANFKVICKKCGYSFNGSMIKRHENVCDGNYKPFIKLKNCKYCDLSFDGLNTNERANHSRWCKSNPKHQYYLDKVRNKNNDSAAILSMNTEASIKKRGESIFKRHKEGRYKEAHNKLKQNRINGIIHNHSIETKEKLSKIRKKFLLENPEKHPWKKSKKLISIPCETFKNYLTKQNIEWEEEYTPIEKRFFSCDIYLKKYKLIVEINGNQHYNSDYTLKKYYKERRSLILNEGFDILELKYDLVYNEDFKNKFLDFLEKRDLFVFENFQKYVIY